MKKTFLTLLFALSIFISIPAAKVDAMDASFVQKLKEAATVILSNNKSDILKSYFFWVSFILSGANINRIERKYVLFLIKIITLLLPTFHYSNKVGNSFDFYIPNSKEKILLALIYQIPWWLGLIFIPSQNSLSIQLDDKFQQKINQLILWYKFKKLLTPRIISQPCSICLEENSSIDTSGSTSCDHTFHKDCLKTWLERNLICPNCRANL